MVKFAASLKFIFFWCWRRRSLKVFDVCCYTCTCQGVDNFFDVGGLTSLHASVHMHLLIILRVHVQCTNLRDDLLLKLQQNSVCFLHCHSHTTLLVLPKIWGGGGFSPLSPHLSTPLLVTLHSHILDASSLNFFLPCPYYTLHTRSWLVNPLHIICIHIYCLWYQWTLV